MISEADAVGADNSRRAADNGSRRWRPTHQKSTLKIIGRSLVRGISATVSRPESMGRLLLIVALSGLFALAAPTARASERLDVNASAVHLAVNGGTALVTYRARGRSIHALVWGAVNARPPSHTEKQVRFRFDWSGGWKTR